MNPRRFVAGVAVMALVVLPARAGEGARSFPIAGDAVIETGDTFVQNGDRVRLYGVQACLPGTTVRLADGAEHDCGQVSIAGLAGLMGDARPTCIEISRSEWRNRPYVFASCSMAIGDRNVELGTALIASGFAFAALTATGAPVHAPYIAAESVAQEDKRGLWSSRAFVHPAKALLSLER